MKEVRIHGRGGQGVAIASRILTSAFVKEGKWASGFPMFGVERRGAPVVAFTRFDDRPVREKTQIYSPDCLIVTDPRLIDSIKEIIFGGIRPNGVLVLNSPHPIQESPHENLNTIGTVDATAIGLQEIGIPATNICMLGAFARTTGWIHLESLIHGLGQYFDGDMLKKNIRCAERGFEEVVVDQFSQELIISTRYNSESPNIQTIDEGKTEYHDKEKSYPLGGPYTGFSTEFEYSWAYGDKLYILNTGHWRFQRPINKIKKCSKCGICYFFCPTGSIKDMENHFAVDLKYCKGCGICASLCPRGAIQMVRES